MDCDNNEDDEKQMEVDKNEDGDKKEKQKKPYQYQYIDQYYSPARNDKSQKMPSPNEAEDNDDDMNDESTRQQREDSQPQEAQLMNQDDINEFDEFCVGDGGNNINYEGLPRLESGDNDDDDDEKKSKEIEINEQKTKERKRKKKKSKTPWDYNKIPEIQSLISDDEDEDDKADIGDNNIKVDDGDNNIKQQIEYNRIKMVNDAIKEMKSHGSWLHYTENTKEMMISNTVVYHYEVTPERVRIVKGEGGVYRWSILDKQKKRKETFAPLKHENAASNYNFDDDDFEINLNINDNDNNNNNGGFIGGFNSMLNEELARDDAIDLSTWPSGEVQKLLLTVATYYILNHKQLSNDLINGKFKFIHYDKHGEWTQFAQKYDNKNKLYPNYTDTTWSTIFSDLDVIRQKYFGDSYDVAPILDKVNSSRQYYEEQRRRNEQKRNESNTKTFNFFAQFDNDNDNDNDNDEDDDYNINDNNNNNYNDDYNINDNNNNNYNDDYNYNDKKKRNEITTKKNNNKNRPKIPKIPKTPKTPKSAVSKEWNFQLQFFMTPPAQRRIYDENEMKEFDDKQAAEAAYGGKLDIMDELSHFKARSITPKLRKKAGKTLLEAATYWIVPKTAKFFKLYHKYKKYDFHTRFLSTVDPQKRKEMLLKFQAISVPDLLEMAKIAKEIEDAPAPFSVRSEYYQIWTKVWRQDYEDVPQLIARTTNLNEEFYNLWMWFGLWAWIDPKIYPHLKAQCVVPEVCNTAYHNVVDPLSGVTTNGAKEHQVCLAAKLGSHRRKTNNGGMYAGKSKYSLQTQHLKGCVLHVSGGNLGVDTKKVIEFIERCVTWNQVMQHCVKGNNIALDNDVEEIKSNGIFLEKHSKKLMEKNNIYFREKKRMKPKKLNFNVNAEPLLSEEFRRRNNLPTTQPASTQPQQQPLPPSIKKEKKRKSDKIEADLDDDELTDDFDDDDDGDIILSNRNKKIFQKRMDGLNDDEQDNIMFDAMTSPTAAAKHNVRQRKKRKENQSQQKKRNSSSSRTTASS